MALSAWPVSLFKTRASCSTPGKVRRLPAQAVEGASRLVLHPRTFLQIREHIPETLADALRDGRAPVAATASQVLAATMSTTTARRVDWRPALPALRDLLGGTNVFLLYDQLEILLRTGIAPDLAPELLAGGHADLIVAGLAARHAATREAAHRFLSHLAGRDLGYDARAWTQWIATLRRESFADPLHPPAFQNPDPIRNASSGIRLRQMSMSRSDLAPTPFDAYTRRRIAPPSTAHADPGLVREEGQRQPHLPLVVDARSFAG